MVRANNSYSQKSLNADEHPWQDLWELPIGHQTASLSDAIEHNFYSRCSPDTRPVAFRNVDSDSPSSTPRPSTTVEDDEEPEKGGADPEKVTPDDEPKPEIKQASRSGKKQKSNPKYDSSLVKAIHVTFFWQIWGAGLLKLLSGMPSLPWLSLRINTTVLQIH